jgi:hypothetical protein
VPLRLPSVRCLAALKCANLSVGSQGPSGRRRAGPPRFGWSWRGIRGGDPSRSTGGLRIRRRQRKEARYAGSRQGSLATSPESNTRGNATCSQSEKTERRFTSTGAVGLGMMAGAKPLFSFRDGSQVTDPSGGGSHADVPLKAQIASISVLPFETFLVDPFPPVISAPDLATHKAASDRAPR